MKVLGVPLADTASDYYRIVEPLRALTWSTDVEAMIVPLADQDSETPVRVVRVGTPGDDELKAAAAEVFPDDAALQAAWIQYQLAVPDAAATPDHTSLPSSSTLAVWPTSPDQRFQLTLTGAPSLWTVTSLL